MWGRSRRLALSLTLALLSALVLGAGCAARAPAALASGVEYIHERHPYVPWSIHIVKIDLARADLRLTAALTDGLVIGLETVENLARSVPADAGAPVAAVNGDYFEIDRKLRYVGSLHGLLIAEGELISGPHKSTFWLAEDGRPQIGTVKANFRVLWPDGTSSGFGLNCAPSDYESQAQNADIVVFTPTFGPSTLTENVRELVLEPARGGAWLPLKACTTYSARVRQVTAAGNTAIHAGTMVLSIARKADDSVPPVQAGDFVTFTTELEPDFSGARTAVGGGPVLLADGRPLYYENSEQHPRTIVGFNDTSLYLVVVDGRQEGLSRGINFAQQSELMLRLGCTDALNLDGGGSSTMWVNGEIVNSPSDGHPRAVAVALVLLRRAAQE